MAPKPGPAVPFGAPMRHAHFAFNPAYTPLNHGSYGTYPVSVRAAHLALQCEVEGAPDPFIALEFHDRLMKSRTIAAEVLHCLVDELVFVNNATTGIDTVFKSLDWRAGDVALCYGVTYDAVRRGLSWIEETRGIEVHTVPVEWPLSDQDLIDACVSATREINAQPGKRVRLAVVDTIISMPGIRVPFEKLVPSLQAEGALVVVDGAHGIGHIDINLSELKPDFFVTNLHKWFFVPRGCAAFYVPKKHQPMIRTSLPTSHGFTTREELKDRPNAGVDAFVEMFDFTGTAATANWLCVEAVLEFRDQICGGEESIREYSHTVAQRGATIAAEILGTDIMDYEGSCIRDCNFANVRLPLELDTSGNVEEGKVDPQHADKIKPWLKVTGTKEDGFYFQTELYRGLWWWRLSGMIYVEEDDFRRGAHVLKRLCERIRRGEHAE